MSYLQKKRLFLMSIANKVKGFVRTISGVPPITLEGCVDNKSVIEYKIYGNSVQDGEPSPDNPVEVVSVGEYDEETGKYKIPITASGKNLLKQNYSLNGVFGGVTFTVNKDNSITMNGTATSTIPVSISTDNGFIDNSSTYTLCGCFGGSTSTYYFQTQNGYRDVGNGVKVHNKEDKNIIRLYMVKGAVLDNVTVYPMLIKGDYVGKVPDYEPYHEPITTNIYLDAPLRAISDYKDYIDFESSKVVRNITKVSNWLTKTDIVGNKNQNTTILLGANGARTIAQTLVYCPIFKGVYPMSNWTSSEENIKSHITKGTDNYAYYNIKYDRLGLVKENDIIYKVEDETKTALTDAQICALVREYFSSNFTEEECSIYVCDYKAPIEETIDLSNLPTFKGTTIYTVDTTVQPTNMEVTYYSTVKE